MKTASSPFANPNSTQPAATNGQLTRTSLRDQATAILRAQITTGELAPDRLYSIGDLALSLGVSPTPVREALLRLSSEGLGHFVANRGFSVAKLNLKDLEQIVACRRLLEPPAMAQVAALPDVAVGIADFYARAEVITQFAREGRMTEFLLLDRDFHLDLTSLTGNGRLVSIVAVLRAQTRLYGIQRSAGSENLIRSANEHTRILDAIAGGDPAAASSAMDSHISHVFGVWSGADEDAPVLH